VKKKILVVDDNVDAADTLTLLLRNGGHDVHTAYGGRDAIQIADTLRPDVVLLDIQMPKMSGYDLVRELRRHERAPRPLLIAVSAWGQESDKLASKQAGFDHHLTKPVDPEALLRLVGAQRS
jgi:two-component system CheB/CheR fusion protein